MSDNGKFDLIIELSNKSIFLVEIGKTNDDQTGQESASSIFNNGNTSTSVRLFGQFKQNGTGFSNFGQLSSNGDTSSSTPSYFTSTLSKISSTNGGGFGASSTSLAASLAPLSSK
jgi:hypothetical protein